MNTFMVVGRVGRDSELRTTNSGEKVLSFSIAEDVGYGENKSVQWFEGTIWGKRAESLAQYIKKGTKVTASGTLRGEQFEKRDGTQGFKNSIRIAEIDFSNKQDGEQRDTQQAGNRGGYGNGGGKPNTDWQAPDRNSGGSRGGGGGKPAFDQSLDDEIPFSYLEGVDDQGCACSISPRSKSMKFEA